MARHGPMTKSIPPTFPGIEHDHRSCQGAALARAEAAFQAQGMRLTDLRRRVFEQIAGSHHAVGAYDVLEALARTGTRLAPISVYRAIDALLSAGVIHRVESRNAFFACHSAHAEGEAKLILVCETCKCAAEIDGAAIFRELGENLAAAAFTPRRTVVEVTGLCRNCGGGA